MTNKTITQLDAAQSLNDNMVIAVQDTNATYKTTLSDVKAYCSSGGDAYAVGDRVTDDSDNDVGMVSGFFTDANDQKYAVVCLNAVDRLAGGQYLSSDVEITGLSSYNNQTLWSATETATTNTTAILGMSGYTSSACTHCRSKSYTIDGVSYAGQFPNLVELVDIFRSRVKINTDDPTATQYSSLVVPTSTYSWSSTQYNSSYGCGIGTTGSANANTKSTSAFVIPVLEIPL